MTGERISLSKKEPTPNEIVNTFYLLLTEVILLVGLQKAINYFKIMCDPIRNECQRIEDCVRP